MQRIDTYQFYSLAVGLHPLTELSEDSVKKVGDIYLILLRANAWLHDLKRGSLGVVLKTSLPSIEDLSGEISQVMSNRGIASWGEDIGFYKDGIKRIVDDAKALENVLSAELRRSDTYFVVKTGAYDTDTLIEHADEVFVQPVREKMSERSREDFCQAGRCLAFDCHTAAGFHALRSTESVIWDYLYALTGEELPRKMRSWGNYIKKLKGAGAESGIIELLDYIRTKFRNPIMHPDQKLDDTQAHNLFDAAKNAISLMITDIQNRPSPPLNSGLLPGS
ncbi:MAG: hypothetical protein ACR2KU_04195 [Gammaproteobacteria bacterium]